MTTATPAAGSPGPGDGETVATPAPSATKQWTEELARLLTELLHQEVLPDPKRPRRSAPTLAAWRRGLGKESMTVPEMWPHVCPVADVVPEAHPRRRAVETAVHHALTLYATHQQSRDEPMHVRSIDGRPGPSLGAACYQLHQNYDRIQRSTDGVERRFHTAATATSTAELAGHLRGIIPLLRGEKIPLDYVRLAHDLSGWPWAEDRARVRRRWGLDFHRARGVSQPSEDTPSTADQET